MNRTDFQRLSRIRVAEARVLLDNEHLLGAYYLLGYAVESALKACIAKQIRRYDFPDKQLVNDSYTHDLGTLLRVSGLKELLDDDLKTDPDLDLNWAIVKDWSEQMRYETSISSDIVRPFYRAVTGRRSGILPWLKKQW